MDRHIQEVLRIADSYIRQVNELEAGYSNGIRQVNQVAQKTHDMVIRHFALLQESIEAMLVERKCVLLNQIQKAQEEGAAPLSLSLSSMRDKIRNVDAFITLGKRLLANPGDKAGYAEFEKQSIELDKHHISSPGKIAHITFEGDEVALLESIKGIIDNYGSVVNLGPVQIRNLSEKPGAILIEWTIADSDEQLADVQEFCLQKGAGDGADVLPNFEDCYKGQDTFFLCKDVVFNEYYSFRVNCKFEGKNSPCRWSIPQSYKTCIKPYSWKENGHYSMNDQFKIVAPLIDAPPILISDGPQFKIGYTIEFTILEMDDTLAHVGLMTEIKKKLSSLEDYKGTFIVDSRGTIKVDGITKSTFLPGFKKNCKICFSCECLKESKVVIHIDIDEKRVTYEWVVDQAQPYYFAAELPTTKWKIMVE